VIFLAEYFEPDTRPATASRIAERARAATRELAAATERAAIEGARVNEVHEGR
jgi:hypothetical protein